MPPAPAMIGCQPSSRAVCEAYVCHGGTGPDPTVKLSPTNIITGACCSAGAGFAAKAHEGSPSTATSTTTRLIRPRMTTSGH
ncbi:hypothetical protein GCM10023334_101250 [Nonomuraea thailandensis]